MKESKERRQCPSTSNEKLNKHMKLCLSSRKRDEENNILCPRPCDVSDPGKVNCDASIDVKQQEREVFLPLAKF